MLTHGALFGPSFFGMDQFAGILEQLESQFYAQALAKFTPDDFTQGVWRNASISFVASHQVPSCLALTR